MNKILPLIIFFELFFTLSHGQISFYDAIALRKLNPVLDSGHLIFPLGVNQNAAEILKNYTDKSTYGGIEKEFETNPFIRLPKIAALSSNSVSGFSNLLSDAGALNVTSLADGFAKFLVKRTKEELNAAFFSKFKELISKDEYKDAQILFPQTYATLRAIGDQIYNYEAYMNALRESFEKDLNSLLPNLKKVIEEGRYKNFFDAQPELKAVCLSSIYVGQELMLKVHPGEIIADYPVDDLLEHQKLIDANGGMKTLQLMSASIRSKSPSRYWVSSDSLKLLLQDPITLKIYWGLIYQRAANIKFSGTDLQTIMRGGDQQLNELKNYLKELQKQAEVVMTSINNLSGKEREKLSFEDYYSFYNSSLNLIEHAVAINKVPALATLKPSDKTADLIKTARMGGNIALDINRRNYSSAIINLYQLYNASLVDSLTKKVKPFILKYGSFMAAVAQAQNPDEVASAIEAAVLPSGSSRIKRESSFNVSLNSYVGIFTGYERIKGVDNSGFKWNTYGVTAPIGIAISRGHSFLFLGTGNEGWEKNKKGWSTSLFLSVVDIGALASFRFSNDTTETVPNIALKDIISPGVFLSIGIPKTPLSVNAGFQSGPILRKVKAAINEYSESYSRFSLSLCVDIPLLNLYTKSRERKLIVSKAKRK